MSLTVRLQCECGNNLADVTRPTHAGGIPDNPDRTEHGVAVYARPGRRGARVSRWQPPRDPASAEPPARESLDDVDLPGWVVAAIDAEAGRPTGNTSAGQSTRGRNSWTYQVKCLRCGRDYRRNSQRLGELWHEHAEPGPDMLDERGAHGSRRRRVVRIVLGVDV